MNSMAAGGYRSGDATNSRRGYREPFAVTTPIFDHKDGYYVRPNMVAIKYHDFKKDVDPNFHVGMFNFVVKANAKTF
jgi:hypothetical protein